MRVAANGLVHLRFHGPATQKGLDCVKSTYLRKLLEGAGEFVLKHVQTGCRDPSGVMRTSHTRPKVQISKCEVTFRGAKKCARCRESQLLSLSTSGLSPDSKDPAIPLKPRRASEPKGASEPGRASEISNFD